MIGQHEFRHLNDKIGLKLTRFCNFFYLKKNHGYHHEHSNVQIATENLLSQMIEYLAINVQIEFKLKKFVQQKIANKITINFILFYFYIQKPFLLKIKCTSAFGFSNLSKNHQSKQLKIAATTQIVVFCSFRVMVKILEENQ